MINKDACNGIGIEIYTKKKLVTLKDGMITVEAAGATFAYRTWTDIKCMIDKMVLVGSNFEKDL